MLGGSPGVGRLLVDGDGRVVFSRGHAVSSLINAWGIAPLTRGARSLAVRGCDLIHAVSRLGVSSRVVLACARSVRAGRFDGRTRSAISRPSPKIAAAQ